MDAKNDENVLKDNISTIFIPTENSLDLIKELELDTNFTNNFKYNEDTIRCKKVSLNGYFYYAFKSTNLKEAQEKEYLDREINRGSFKEENYEGIKSSFGVIVFKSYTNTDCKKVYKAYIEREETKNILIEYKNIIYKSEDNIHGNYRLIATEFINFISCIMKMRIIKELERTKLLDKYSQPEIMRYLSKYIKKRSQRKKDTWVTCTQ